MRWVANNIHGKTLEEISALDVSERRTPLFEALISHAGQTGVDATNTPAVPVDETQENVQVIPYQEPTKEVAVPQEQNTGLDLEKVRSTLAPQQKLIFDTIVQAGQNNELDQVISGDGKMQYAAIAEKAGLKNRGAAQAAINQTIKKIDAITGVNTKQMLASKRNVVVRAGADGNLVARRLVEPSVYDSLGVKPATPQSSLTQDSSNVDNESLQGSEDAGPSMGSIKSLGATDTDQGSVITNNTRAQDAIMREGTAELEKAGALDVRGGVITPEGDVAPSEKAVQVANANRQQHVIEMLSHDEAKNASVDYNDFKSDSSPAFADLSAEEKAEFISSYVEALEHAEKFGWEDSATLDVIANEVKDFERGIDHGLSNEKTVTDLDKRIAGSETTNSGKRPTISAKNGQASVATITTAKESEPSASNTRTETTEVDYKDQIDATLEKADKLIGRVESGLKNPSEYADWFESIEPKISELRAKLDALFKSAGMSVAEAKKYVDEYAGKTFTDFIYKGSQGSNTRTETTEVDDAALLTSLNALSKDKTHSAIANDFLNKARQGEDVRTEAAKWVDAVNDDIQFSKDGETKGTTADAIRAVVKALTGNASNWRVTVYNNASEAVAGKFLKSNETEGVQAWVDADKNGVLHAYFIADNIKPGRELAVFLHEVGAHMGLERLLTTKEYGNLLDQINKWANLADGSRESVLAQKAINRVLAAGTKPSQQEAETLAYFIEEAVKSGVDPIAMKYNSELGLWFRKLWAAYKAALRRLNINPAKLNAQNIVDLAYGAARLELSGKWQGGAAKFYKHSNNHRGTGEGGKATGDKSFTDMVAYGQYFADRIDTAKGYRDRAARKDALTYDGKTYEELSSSNKGIDDLVSSFMSSGSASKAVEYINDRKSVLQKGITRFEEKLASGVPETHTDYKAALAAYKEQLGKLNSIDTTKFSDAKNAGALYNTDFNVAEDEWLHWDRTLDEQVGKAKTALETVKADLEKAGLLDEYLERKNADFGELYASELYKQVLNRAHMDGADFLNAFDEQNAEKAISAYLDSIGIKGVKYEDNQSRGNWARHVDNRRLDESPETLKKAKEWATTALGFDNSNAYQSIGELNRDIETLGEKVPEWFWSDKKGTIENYNDKSTYNYVVFNPKNTVVGAKETGTEERAAMFSKSITQATNDLVDSLPPKAQEPVRYVSDVIHSGLSAGLRGSMFTSHLIEMVKGVLPSAQAWYDAIDAREVSRHNFEAKIDTIANAVDALDYDSRQRTWKFIQDSTTDGKWGYIPDWKDVAVDSAAEAKFKALSTTEQNVIKQVFKHGAETLKETQNLLDKNLDDTYESKLAAAKTPEAKATLEKEKAKFQKMYGRKLAEMQGPYAPMRRVGSHVVVAKSQAYIDAVAAGNKSAVDTMRSDGIHFHVEFHDSMAMAKRAQRILETKYAYAEASAKQKTNFEDALPFSAFEKLRGMADEKDGAAAKKLSNMITELYLTSLADTSARKSEMRRGNISGLNPDTMYRAFLAKGQADAHYLSVLGNHKAISLAYGNMIRESNELDEAGKAAKKDILNELTQRYENSFDYSPSPTIGKLMSLNSTWMLLTKPAYYFYNATQPLMMSQPYMAGKYGYNKSFSALTSAYSELKKMPSFNIKSGFMDLEGTPPDVKQALTELRNMGRLDITLTQELGSRIHVGESAVSRTMATVTNKLSGFAQKVEMTNRIVTASAAYRLALPELGHAKAVEYAKDVIDNTHGNYSNFNAPRYFNQSPIARVVTQFRKFQLIQLSLFVREWKEMQKGTTAAEKWALSKALRYTLAHHAIMAGGMGLPAANLVALAFAAMGDDDDKKDLELEARKAIGDDFFSALLLHGVPAAVLNMNMSGNVGAGQMLSVLPYQDFNLVGRRNASDTLIALSGPLIGGTFLQGADALQQGHNGEYYKMLAGLAPSGIKSALKAGLEATQGVTNTKGDTTVSPEEITLWDTALKGVGIRTETDSVRSMVQSKKYDFEQFFNGRTHDLKNQYAKAYKKGDGEAMQEARDHWIAMQGFKKEYGFATQPISNLLKAPVEQRKREKDTMNGVQFRKQSKGFVEQATQDDTE
jgi:hypothetical protein